MEGLSKKIKGDWFDLREAAEDPYELEELFSFDGSRIKSIAGDLRMAVEQGVYEYKNHALSNLYSFLDSYQYDSRGFDTLDDQSTAFSEILYVTLLQRLVCLGKIEIKGPKPSENLKHTPLPGIKEIMLDVQERIKNDPTLKANQSIKNILMQMSIYRNELEKMREFEPKILPDKKESFLANFKEKFAEITSKIQEHYGAILAVEEKEAAQDYEEINPLKRYDIKTVAKLLFDQAAEISTIRSTLLFAVSERFKTREILSNVTDRRERTLLLLRMEPSAYQGLLGKGGDASILGKAFAQELIKVLARQLSRMPE